MAEGRLGVRLDEDPAQARAALETCVAEAAAANAWLLRHPPTVTWPGVSSPAATWRLAARCGIWFATRTLTPSAARDCSNAARRTEAT
jgi:hypothetical protein